jgi:hypothetical protein
VRTRWAAPLAALAGLAALLLLEPPVVTSTMRAQAPMTTEPASDAGAQRAGLLQLQREAAALLQQAARAGSVDPGRGQLLTAAAGKLEALAAQASGSEAPRSRALLPPDLLESLRNTAMALRADATAHSASSIVTSNAILEKVAAALRAGPDDEIPFEGSYSQTKVAEPVYGGHASAMGPPPESASVTGGRTNVTSPVQFDDVPCLAATTYCGGRTKDHILESGGSGVALLDYDGDGWLDVYLITAAELSAGREQVPHRNALFRNLGGWRFQDVSAGSGLDVAAWGNGVCAGDYDGDGRLDLYVTNFGPNFLFRNDGDGKFSEAAVAAGAQSGGWSTGCTFFDADADGDLDLYVVGYVHATWSDVRRAQRTLTWRGGPKTMVGPKGLPGEGDRFFENRGDGTFVDATQSRGLTDAASAYGYGVVATDYDNDGWIDLFVANDTMPNFLYRNRGHGQFESVGLAAGVALNGEGRAQAGMGVDSGDYDGDGRLDFAVTNFAHDTNTLYQARDGGAFEDVTAAVGLAGPTFVRMGWGVAFLDADLDGRSDLFFANGHIYPDVDQYPQLQESFRQTNQLFWNSGTGFVDVSPTAGSGLQVAKSSRGLGVGDLDNDGDLDLIVTNVDDTPTVMRNQQRTANHWIQVQLDQAGGNRFCIGARVTIAAGGTRQVREIRSGGSYLSQNDLRAHFGLGPRSGPVDVEVRMPGGGVWQWRNQPVDRLLRLTLDTGGSSGRSRP